MAYFWFPITTCVNNSPKSLGPKHHLFLHGIHYTVIIIHTLMSCALYFFFFILYQKTPKAGLTASSLREIVSTLNLFSLLFLRLLSYMIVKQ